MNAARTARVGWVRPANWSEHHNREAAGAHTHRVRRRIAWLSCSPTQAVLIASFRVSPAARSRRRCAQRRGVRAWRGLQHPHRGFATLPIGLCQAARRTGQGLITDVLSPSDPANVSYRPPQSALGQGVFGRRSQSSMAISLDASSVSLWQRESLDAGRSR